MIYAFAAKYTYNSIVERNSKTSSFIMVYLSTSVIYSGGDITIIVITAIVLFLVYCCIITSYYKRALRLQGRNNFGLVYVGGSYCRTRHTI